MQTKRMKKTPNTLFTLMEDLVAINSVLPREEKLTNFIEKFLLEIGFEVERVSASTQRDCLVATFGTAHEYICLYGHMDTVPPDPLWKNDPFAVTYDTENAYGLGVADMKGGLAVILRTAVFAKENSLALKVAFGVDEEGISLGSHVLSQHEFFNDVSAMIVAESGQVFNNNQDFAVNYGRKGRFVAELEIRGVTAHAARSDEAVNAITEVSKVLQLLSTFSFTDHQRLGKVEIIPFYIHSETSAFSIPDRTVLRLNILTVPSYTSNDILAQLRNIFEKENLDVIVSLVARDTPYMEAYEVDINSPFIKKVEGIFANYSTKPGYAISVGDENRFAHILQIPIISIGPVGGGDHTAHEWVSLLSLKKTEEVYKEIIQMQNIRKPL